MAANVLYINNTHNQARIQLRGDMSVSFDEVVDSGFMVTFFTTTDEQFAFDSNVFTFKDLQGNDVSGFLVGGRPSTSIELMFDPDGLTWYITSHNVSQSSGSGPDLTEKPLVFSALPEMTPINYANGKNYRGKLTADAKLANPTGMKPGDSIRIVIEQDLVGNRKLTYDGAYGWKEAIIPVLSTVPQAVDILDFYMTSDYTLICDLRLNYSVVRPIAFASNFAYTMDAAYVEAASNPITGQTVQVIRDGWRTEVNGSIGFRIAGFDLRVKGVPKSNGELPILRLDKADRPTFGKALVNIEGGRNVVIEDLRIAGASAFADGNGTGVLINPGVDYVLIKNVHLLENENGVRSANSSHPRYDLENVFLEKNGWAANSLHLGQSHSIYAGPTDIWRGLRTTFFDSVAGHNIKTRGKTTVLNQVYSRKCNKGREIDCPDQGILHATDCVFWKESSAGQNNLIGIGHECLDGFGRVQEYFFINCYFHNDVDPGREVTYLENRARGENNNTAVVHFIDCLFGGKANTKVQSRGSLLQGPYTITVTGGPLGPRVPVGSTHMLFNPASIDPAATPNPLNIVLTPFADLPPMTVTEPAPPYPTFVEVLPVPPLPDYGAGQPQEPDTEAPVVSLSVTSTSITAIGGVTLTASATDNKGISKVEFYRNDVLLYSDTSMPYSVIESFTHLDNGAISYKAVAYDFSDNSTTSNEVVVNVNIEPPHLRPETALNEDLQMSYDAAIVAGTTGNKRTAAAQSILTAFGNTQELNVYRNGALVMAIQSSSPLLIVDNGHDVYVKLDGDIDNYESFGSPNLTTGEWWYELVGGNGDVITGSVGPIGSGADFTLSENPGPNVAYSVEFKFVIPRSVDNLE